MNLNNSYKDVNPETGEEIKRNEYRKMGIYDFVRRDIERFFAHPEEAIVSPQLTQPQLPKAPPEFVRNVWGSAAGVGSGDFHIYRGIRRREYARLELIEKTAEEELLDKEFQLRQKELQDLAAEKTAKKRAKRQMKKAKRIAKRKLKSQSKSGEDSDDDDDCSGQQVEEVMETENSELDAVEEKSKEQ
uniref:PRKR-interacting protein 1 homolog n=1 Tax=Trichobilharzia regenti TaxID=157069 RepID=A0AA85KCP5_TRIRE|nr:unnamed protein product [Trichobilharzia regenti]